MAELKRVEFFTSHEGLHLEYEQAQTRQVPRRTAWYNLSTHFPWIGDRTRGIGGAHVEYFRGIANPIAMKVGPSITPDELLDLAAVLNPDNEPGRLTVIHRFGAGRIEECLPPLVEALPSGRQSFGVATPCTAIRCDRQRRQDPRLRRHPRRVGAGLRTCTGGWARSSAGSISS